MSEIGYGYGSEWHLLRYLGYHRQELNRAIERVTGGQVLDWLDFRFNRNKKFLDVEWQGLDFLSDAQSVKAAWRSFWPQSGNVQNWDAVRWLRIGEHRELLLVEAKAHINELRSSCTASERGGLPTIKSALDAAKDSFGADTNRNWLIPYYQYCNRLAVLHFLMKHKVPARLIFVYFSGDANPNASCPQTEAEWEGPLREMDDHIGLTGESLLEGRVHKVFLPVCQD